MYYGKIFNVENEWEGNHNDGYHDTKILGI